MMAGSPITGSGLPVLIERIIISPEDSQFT